MVRSCLWVMLLLFVFCLQKETHACSQGQPSGIVDDNFITGRYNTLLECCCYDNEFGDTDTIGPYTDNPPIYCDCPWPYGGGQYQEYWEPRFACLIWHEVEVTEVTGKAFGGLRNLYVDGEWVKDSWDVCIRKSRHWCECNSIYLDAPAPYDCEDTGSLEEAWAHDYRCFPCPPPNP